MEVGLVESVEQSVFVDPEHQHQADGGEGSDNGLQGEEEAREVGRFYYVGVLVAQLELVAGKDTVQLVLSFQLLQPLLGVQVVVLPQPQDDVVGVKESSQRQHHVDEGDEEDIGHQSALLVDGNRAETGQDHGHSDTVHNLTDCDLDSDAGLLL